MKTRFTVLLAVVLLASAPRPEPSPAIPGASSQSSISIDTSEDATGTLATARTGAPTAGISGGSERAEGINSPLLVATPAKAQPTPSRGVPAVIGLAVGAPRKTAQARQKWPVAARTTPESTTRLSTPSDGAVRPLIALGQGALTTGHASWYADPRKAQGSLYAAMPGYRWGHPFWVTVRYGSRSLRVRVSDFCQCHVGRRDAKVIDLSWRAFVVLTRLPLSRGIARVVVER